MGLLRTAALTRLSMLDAEALTPTVRAHSLGQRLVNLTWQWRPSSFPAVNGAGELSEPPVLPEVRPHGAGSQLAVVGSGFLVAATTALAAADGAGRRRIQRALADASQECVALRRAL